MKRLAPGLLVALLVGIVSLAVAEAEVRVIGHAVIEALVVALLLGMLVRLGWRPSAAFEPGIKLAGKELLELSVVLLGISVDLPLLVRAGPALGIAIVLIVVLGLTAGRLIARALGLEPRLATLVATGNAICGNSAIAAVAPVIGADAEDVASSIAFTAILGVIVVLGLPLLIAPLGLTHYQYGVLAGLSVYAVPQVLAAAFPVSTLSGEVATLVKLVRVLMLGPVVLFFALRARNVKGKAPSLATLVPWFIVGFLVLASLRAVGVVPAGWVAPTRLVSMYLTILAMAALGLSADLRSVAKAGSRVVAAVSLSLVLLIVLGIAFIRVLSIG
ncbi:MAG TPA: putative sulfate exporter family transporter [Gemmatimonadaceae bacterium]|nr:putative sulfate exporter family transporter [Gemmatimonadaceae bacterium]